jgi:hypothetical protein
VISVILWKWGSLFGPEYPNRMRSMLARHLHLPHKMFCVTDDPSGLDPEISIVDMPQQLADTPRCRRRMQQYSAEFDWLFGERLLSIDLDVVIVGDITPLVARREPIACWRVGYADVYSGSFVLWNAGALDGAWQAYRSDPDGYPQRAQPRGLGSDQAMLNLWLRESRTPVAEWTERDGFVSYFGDGYERMEHYGVGPNRQALPLGARVVVLGSADKSAMDNGVAPWILEYWR